MTDDELPPPDKLLPGDRGAWLYPLTYGRMRIVVGRIGSPLVDDGW